MGGLEKGVAAASAVRIEGRGAVRMAAGASCTGAARHASRDY
jgi:hypothetical protein